MKIRTYKARVNNMLNWYSEQVTRDLQGVADVRTFAGMELATRALKMIQYEQVKKEPQTPEWKFPVVANIHFEPGGLGEVRVRLDEEWEKENVLYLDFDTVK